MYFLKNAFKKSVIFLKQRSGLLTYMSWKINVFLIDFFLDEKVEHYQFTNKKQGRF